MNKLKYFLLVAIIFISCKKEEGDRYIHMYNHKQSVPHLTGNPETLRLDSVRFVKSDEKDWSLVNPIASCENLKVAEDEIPNAFSVIDFYSDAEKKQFKTIYSSFADGAFKVVSEQDRFYKKLNDTIAIYLNRNFNHLNHKTIYSTDSVPTLFFIVKNQNKLKKMRDYAKKNHLELCGTAAQEILTKGFPNQHTEINQSQFNQLKSELKTRNPEHKSFGKKR